MAEKDLKKILDSKFSKIRDLDGKQAISRNSLIYEASLEALKEVYNDAIYEAMNSEKTELWRLLIQ